MGETKPREEIWVGKQTMQWPWAPEVTKCLGRAPFLLGPLSRAQVNTRVPLPSCHNHQIPGAVLLKCSNPLVDTLKFSISLIIKALELQVHRSQVSLLNLSNDPLLQACNPRWRFSPSCLCPAGIGQSWTLVTSVLPDGAHSPTGLTCVLCGPGSKQSAH